MQPSQSLNASRKYRWFDITREGEKVHLQIRKQNKQIDRITRIKAPLTFVGDDTVHV